MSNRLSIASVCFAFILASAPAWGAQPAGTTRTVNGQAVVNWTAQAAGGAKVCVPLKGAVSVVLFAMADQSRSRDAADQLADAIKGRKGINICVVVSGKGSEKGAAAVASFDPLPWPVVADPDYAASALFGVHVWPTTIVVNGDGAISGHLAGLPKNYRTDLDAHLELAAGKIDRRQLDHLLSSNDTITDDPEQMAHRHLILADRLLNKGLVDQAKKELDAACALNPRSPQDLLAMARTMVAVGRSEQAFAVLKSIDPTAVSPSVLNLLMGESLASQGKWAQAAEKYAQALNLNPEPAEAYYRMGIAYDHLNQSAKAAEAYRKAFEYTDLGKRLRQS